MALRSPIVSVLGHVDHGKSSILDAIRGTNILATEAGAITQAIGASIIPTHVLKQKCGKLLEALKMELTLPGLLFIDTPGHAAFTSLRKRGGTLADIAILAVDINEGCKPQTLEAIEILKNSKTPFLIAANKIDMLPGYRKQKENVLADIKAQSESFQTAFETKLYQLVGTLHDEFGMSAERFDRVESFTKQVAIVPVSAKEQHGIGELLMVLAGLAQKFLEENLKLDVSGPGKGTILEVKETKGFGTTIDVILYDGVIRKNDTIVIGTLSEPIVTNVRALLEPKALQEMRDKKSKFVHMDEAVAATGLKVAAPDLDRAVAGMPLRVVRDDEVDAVAEQLRQRVQDALIDTDDDGLIIKADTIGSLEALIVLLREKEIPVRKASVGSITKKDIADAESNWEQDPLHAVILGFNIPEEPSTEKAKIFTSDIIYRLIDNLEEWQEAQSKSEAAKKLDTLTKPCKIEILQGCIFRQSNPCVAGVEVVAGTLKTGTRLMTPKGKPLTTVQSIQKDKKSLAILLRGEQAAVSMPGVTAGRQIEEHDVLYSVIPQEEFRKLKDNADLLSGDEKGVLKEIAQIMREDNPVWGV